MNIFCRLLISISVVFVASAAYSQDWIYGIGTGLAAMDVDGDGGFGTALGPIDFDASMSSSEINRVTKSAIGFGGFAKKDDLRISYSIAQSELEDDLSGTEGGITGVLDLTFKVRTAEVLLEHTLYRSGKSSWGLIDGLRYLHQKYESRLTINGTQIFDDTVDDYWLDAILGVTHAYSISPRLTWSTQLDYGFGGSDRTTHFKTGFSKVIGSRWILGGGLDFKNIKYEEGDRDDLDWFLYDAKETSIVVSFQYLF